MLFTIFVEVKTVVICLNMHIEDSVATIIRDKLLVLYDVRIVSGSVLIDIINSGLKLHLNRTGWMRLDESEGT
jgi:hypothetical protein